MTESFRLLIGLSLAASTPRAALRGSAPSPAVRPGGYVELSLRAVTIA
jgi:hypothetical protein